MKHKLRLWYHTLMMRHYGKLTESVDIFPDFSNIDTYERYRQRHIHHKNQVKSLLIGELQEGA